MDVSVDKPSELRVTNSTFKQVCEVGFERRGIAANYGSEGVSPWLKRIRHEGVDRLALLFKNCEPDAKAQSSAWGILTDSERGLELWQPSWRKRLGSHPHDLTPWLVVYSGERFNRWNLKPPAPVEVAAEGLVQSLEELIKACQRGQVAGKLKQPLTWCLDQHRQQNVEMMVAPDLCPSQFPVPLQALVASALRAMHLMSNPAWNGEGDAAVIRTDLAHLWTSAMMVLESVGHESGYAERLAA
jgi:hypothetical protein